MCKVLGRQGWKKADAVPHLMELTATGLKKNYINQISHKDKNITWISTIWRYEII